MNVSQVYILYIHSLIPDRLMMMIRSQKSDCIIIINGQINVWKCKRMFPSDILQQKIEITDLTPCLALENTSVLIMLATAVFNIFSRFNTTRLHLDKRYIGTL